MDVHQLETDKLKIISWVSQLQDYSVVEKIVSIMSAKDTSSLTFEQKNAIDQAINSIETIGTISNETVKEDTRKRYPHLFTN